MVRYQLAVVLMMVFAFYAAASSVTESVTRAAPYVSCLSGHIVETVDKCPPIVKHRPGQVLPYGGGGSGGLLGLGIGGIL